MKGMQVAAALCTAIFKHEKQLRHKGSEPSLARDIPFPSYSSSDSSGPSSP